MAVMTSLDAQRVEMRRALEQYAGYTYSRLLDNALCHYLWRRVFCCRGWHLWDEVLSGLGERHYLSCDACEETLDIASREVERTAKEELAHLAAMETTYRAASEKETR